MSADGHVTGIWLQALADGKVTAAFMRDLVLKHLFAICPVCAREYAAWLEARGGSLGSHHPKALGAHAARGAAPENPKAAERDFRELAGLPVEDCEKRIDRARTRFRGVRLVELLLAESDRHLPDNPWEAYRYAEVGQAVARRSFGASASGVRAAGRMGNAMRALSNLDRAEALFGFARLLAAAEEVADARASAELDRYEGSLRIEQRRFGEAEEVLARSAKLYELLGDRRAEVHLEHKLAFLYYCRGELGRAVEAGNAVLGRLRREREPLLYLCAENNLALYLCDSGSYRHALAVFDEDWDFCRRHADRHTTLQRMWIGARATAGLGDFTGAEEALKVVRAVFLKEERGYDSAMVSLDLALVYAKAGKTRELRETAEALLPIFRARDLHHEAAAALRLFLAAVHEGRASAIFVEKVTRYLRRAQFDPTLAFRLRHDGH